AGSPLAFFNQAIASRHLSDPPAAIEAATAFFEPRVPAYCLMIVGDDRAAIAAAEASGFAARDSIPLMMLAPDELVAPAPPPELEIRPAADLSFVDLFGVGFVDDVGARGPFHDVVRAAAAVDGWDLFGGFVDGEGVATSAAFTLDGCTGVFTVGTSPAARGRGIGAAMTVAAVGAGRARGSDTVFLFASAMGFPIYRRLGFRTVSSHRYIAQT
ncbi:MAG TPA: GNAT family N-acetyltransferase, partial [Actinomycetota bacterium]|nr:GNAT family N-acetyltransferase [Actinomycetota bacterium]